MNVNTGGVVLLIALLAGAAYSIQPPEAEKATDTQGAMQGYVWRYERISDRGSIGFTAVEREYSGSPRKHTGYTLTDCYGTLDEHFLVVTYFDNDHRDVIPVRQLRYLEFRDRKEIQASFDDAQAAFVAQSR